MSAKQLAGGQGKPSKVLICLEFLRLHCSLESETGYDVVAQQPTYCTTDKDGTVFKCTEKITDGPRLSTQTSETAIKDLN